MPIEFARGETQDKPAAGRGTGNPLAAPPGAYVPYNAQATVHTYAAFWAMLLPSTVSGRVSDIWRAYFAERLFVDLDLAVVFTPPVVTQVRNAHNYLSDMEAEQALYLRAG